MLKAVLMEKKMNLRTNLSSVSQTSLFQTIYGSKLKNYINPEEMSVISVSGNDRSKNDQKDSYCAILSSKFFLYFKLCMRYIYSHENIQKILLSNFSRKKLILYVPNVVQLELKGTKTFHLFKSIQ